MPRRILKKMKYLFLSIQVAFLKHKKQKKHQKKWAIIGLGHMANVFARLLTIDDNSYIIAVSSRNINKAKKFAQKFNITEYFDDYRLMIDSIKNEVDVIYIATPAGFHFEAIQYSLQNGVNVFCEKPIVSSMDKLSELMNIATKNSVHLIEAMWSRTLPTYLQTLNIIQNGLIGDIRIILVNFYKNVNYTDIDKKNINKYSVIDDYGIYALDFVANLLGRITSVKSVTRIFDNELCDTDWHISLLSDEKYVNINLSSNFISTSNAAIIGSSGSIQFDSQFNRTNVIRVFDKFGRLVSVHKNNYKFGGYEYEINEVNKILNKGIINSPLDIINTVKTIKLRCEIEKYLNEKINCEV